MTAFATAGDLATYLQRDLDEFDSATAELLLDLASAAIRSYTGQTISAETDDVVTLDPPYGYRLFLPQLPVTDVASVTVAGTLYDPAAEYAWYGDTGMVRLVRGWWGTTAKSVVIVYSHGYAPGSPELGVAQGVCLALAKRTLETAGGGGVKSESIGNYSVTYEAVQSSLHASDDEAESWRSSLRALRPLVLA